MANIFMPPDILAEIPVDVSIDAWTPRLKAEQTLTESRSLGFVFTDLDESYGLTIRRGVCQLDTDPENEMDMVLYMTKPVFNEVLSGNTTIEAAVLNGGMTLTGELSELNRFLDYFETPGANPLSFTWY